MKTRTLVSLGLGAVLSLGVVAGLSTRATAQTHQTCHMKGAWNGNMADIWEFDAAYIYNRGEDDFTGVYSNPGIAQANVTGSARGGTWNIVLSYIDPNNRGSVKRLVGTGMQDNNHGILIRGTYQFFKPGVAAPFQSGTFTMDGKCR